MNEGFFQRDLDFNLYFQIQYPFIFVHKLEKTFNHMSISFHMLFITIEVNKELWNKDSMRFWNSRQTQIIPEMKNTSSNIAVSAADKTKWKVIEKLKIASGRC